MEIIVGVLMLIQLIVFFVMATNIAGIKKALGTSQTSLLNMEKNLYAMTKKALGNKETKE